MPELPEVQNTVNGINETVIGRTIVDVWSGLPKKDHVRENEIKNLKYWNKFKKAIKDQKIIRAERRGKNILIHLSSKDILLIHMKMTGHVMYGKYRKGKKTDGEIFHDWPWWPNEPSLQDPYNRFVHVVFFLDNGKHLVFSDARKFGKVTLLDKYNKDESMRLAVLGVDALDPKMNYKIFKERLEKKPNGRIKNVLMEQSIITGIGNIYADEMLWKSDLHPENQIKNIPDINLKKLYKSMKPLLQRGIDFGGDSTSDYRNIHGEKGKFQNKHNAYKKKGEKCNKRSCGGVIIRKVVGGRSASFCDSHQKLFK